MPVYLAHGFKWARDGLSGIRAYGLMNNLEDLSGEYLQSEQTANVMLQSFRETFPDIMPKLEDPRSGRTLYFLEQYDPEDESSDTAASQYFCFVADRYITIAAGPNPVYPDALPPPLDPRNGQKQKEERPKTSNGPTGARAQSRPATAKTRNSKTSSPLPIHDIASLSVNVDEALSGSTGSSPDAWAAFAELRDQLAEGEKIGWWIIYNGDPARPWIDDSESYTASYEDTDGSRTPTQSEPYANTVLGLPLPSLLPKDFAPNLNIDSGIGIAVPHPPPYPPPPPPLERPAQFDGTTPPRPKSSRSFTLRKKFSRAHLHPKAEPVPDLPKLKEMSKKEGFRARFFGRSKLQS